MNYVKINKNYTAVAEVYFETGEFSKTYVFCISYLLYAILIGNTQSYIGRDYSMRKIII